MAAGDTPETGSASSRPGTSGTQTSESGRRTETPADINIVMRCAMKGNVEKVRQMLRGRRRPI